MQHQFHTSTLTTGVEAPEWQAVSIHLVYCTAHVCYINWRKGYWTLDATRYLSATEKLNFVDFEMFQVCAFYIDTLCLSHSAGKLEGEHIITYTAFLLLNTYCSVTFATFYVLAQSALHVLTQ